MEVWLIFACLYAPTIGAALYLTRCEQKRNSIETDGFYKIGLALCPIWPLVGLVMIADYIFNVSGKFDTLERKAT